MDYYLYTPYFYHLFMTKVEIKCTENGPNMIIVDNKVFAAMCRCGASSNKPYCDGTHAKIGFKAEAKEIKVLG